MRRFAHVVGFDDAPFARAHRGDVMVVGAVYAGARLEGVLATRVRRDGANATRSLAECVQGSRFRAQLHAVLLQGIAFAGFNVVDLAALHAALALPVLAVARRKPDLRRIRAALLGHVRGGARKWRLVERAGPMEPLAGLWVQRAGLSSAEAASLIRRFAVNGRMPEPLRAAHLIAGGVATGESRHRA
ncbi:MAG: DUF99 family protein [Burkholderiales bacterium]